MRKKSFERFPAGKPIHILLPRILDKISLRYTREYHGIQVAVKEILGDLDSFIKIVKFDDGCLTIKVLSAMAYVHHFTKSYRSVIHSHLQKKFAFVRRIIWLR